MHNQLYWSVQLLSSTTLSEYIVEYETFDMENTIKPYTI